MGIQIFNKGVLDHDFDSFYLELNSSKNETIHILYAFYQQLEEEQYFHGPDTKFSNITQLQIEESNGSYTFRDEGLLIRGRGYCKLYLIVKNSEYTPLFNITLHLLGNNSEKTVNMIGNYTFN